MNLLRMIGSLAAMAVPGGLAAATSFFGVGQLPGTTAASSHIRDAVNTPGGIVAVGAARLRSASAGEDVAVRWTPAGGLVALPDFVSNNAGTSFITASALTLNGDTIFGRSRSVASGNARVASRWIAGGSTVESLGYLPGGSTTISAANATSADGSVVYGFGANAAGNLEPFRWTSAGMVSLGFLNSGDLSNIPAARAASADGAIMAGTSGGTAGPGAGNRAYRYVQGSGMTALPLPGGATWSSALGLSSDGNYTLFVANPTATPNGAAFIWRQPTNDTVAIGTPNPQWAPANIGGINTDGFVPVMNFGNPDPNRNEGAAFIRNSHGWFNLHHVIARSGVDLSGWSLDTVLGVSADATLVFGHGMHNGVREGWVAKFDPGALAAVTSAATIDVVFVGKVRELAQSGPTAVAEVTGTPWQLHASIAGHGFTTSDPAPPNQVTPPSGGSAGPVTLAFLGPEEWRYETDNEPTHGYATQAALDAAFANGSFAFNFGPTMVNVSLTGDLYPAGAVATLSAGTWSGGKLQLDVSQPLTITTSFGATNYAAGESYLGIEVKDSGFDINNGGNLTTSTLSLTIPAFALTPNRTYHVTLDAIRAVSLDTTAIPGVKIVGGYETVTGFDIQTSTTAPTIASFSPSTIASGLPVTITGTNFTGATNVQFGGTNATFTVDSATQITATVPFGLPTSAAISVTTAGGTGTSSSNYTLTFAPVITGFSPASGPTGRVVTITGANLNYGTPTVRFNGTPLNFGVNVTPNQLTVMVPVGATTGTITVDTFQGSATSTSTFTVASGPPPANDNFAGAIDLTGNTGSVAGTTVNATGEVGEPRHAGGSFDMTTVWYRFTAPGTGRYLFDPTGSEIRTGIAVYTGTALNTLNLVGVAASATQFGGNFSGSVELNATAGAVYYLVVDGVGRMNGDFTLHWSQVAAPTIASFTPASGYAGQMVTITGTGFTPTARITIGGATPSALRTRVNSATSITIDQLPLGAVTGPIVITTLAGTATSASNFTVATAPPPSIASFTPASGPVGSTVTINGTALALGNALQDVRFNGVPAFANFFTGNSTALFTNVPPTATTGAISVVTAAGTATSSTNFTVTGPAVGTLTPANGRWGTTLNIAGSGFTGATTVFFAPGIAATPTVNSDTSISVTVPVGAGTGPISVSTPAGAGTSTVPFTLDAPSFTAQNPKPNAAQLGAIAFGNGVYVAAGVAGNTGAPGEIWRSTDSVNWTPVFHGSGGINALTFANGVFVAVGNNGTLLSSADGNTWADASWAGETLSYGAVAFASGKFVALAGGGRVRTSADGVNWSAPRQFANFSGDINGLAFGAGLFVAAGSAGDSALFFTSPDGNDWAVHGYGTTNRLRHIAFANGQFVAVGENGTVLTSPDGLAWTTRPLPNSFNSTVFASTFGAGKYVAVSFGTVFTSTDAATWTSANISGDLRSLLFANSQFVGAGSPGCVMTSPDAATWTLRTGFTFDGFSDAAYGNGRYVAVGSGAQAATSADGQTWTLTKPIVSGRSIPVRRVVYAKGKFVAVGENDIWASSPDGVTWSGNPTIVNGRNLNALAFGNGLFVAAGSGGVVRTSSDGVNWTLAEPATGLSGSVTINGLKFANNLFVAVGNGGAIFTSADSLTWTPQTSGVTANLNSVKFAAGIFVAVGDNSTVLTSANATTWTARTLGTSGVTLSDVAFGDGWFVAVPRSFPNAGDVYISADGIGWARRTVGLARFNNGGTAGIAYGNGRFLGASNGGQLSLSDPLPGALSITTQPIASTTVAPGGTVTLSVTAAGTGLNYQWYQGFSGDTSTPATGTGATTATFTSGAINQATQFWVRVSGANGAVVDSQTTSVTSSGGGPGISVQPTPFTSIKVGGSVTLSVTATGSGTLTYQWKRNGFDLANATNASFTLSNAAQSDSDRYTVAVSDGFGTALSNAARVLVAPNAYPTKVRVASGFDLDLETQVQGAVNVIVPLGGGKYVLGGDFVRINGTPRRRLVLLDNGTVDPNFAPNFNPNVSAALLVPNSGGQLLVAGSFSNLNGTPRNGIVRLNADGTVDPTFNAGGAGANGGVFGLARQADGRIVIGGTFTSYNGVTVNRLARLNADGTLDTSLNMGSGANSTINAVALDTSVTPARILIGGSFTNYNGTNVNRLARLNADGSFDASFNVGGGPGSTVSAVTYDAANNAVLIGGFFTNFNGTPINRLARLTSAGALDSTFAVGSDTTAGPNNNVTTIVLDPTVTPARVLVSGTFSSYNNNNAFARLVRLDNAGALDSSFAPNPSSNVNAILPQSDGTILIGGGFASLAGNVTATRFARLTATGALDTNGNLLTSARGLGTATQIIPLPNAKLLVTGVFTHVNNVPIGGVIRLNSDLTVDSTFNPGGAGTNLLVNAAVVQGDGKIVIGGNFSTYNGVAANRVARLNADGTLDASFNIGVGPNNTVVALYALPGGRLYVAGNFNNFNNLTPARPSLVRVNGDGTLDDTFNAGATAFNVSALDLQSDGRLVVGGSFSLTVNTVAITNLIRLTTTGAADLTWNIGTGMPNAQVRVVRVQPDDKIVIGGDFSNFGPTAANRIARLNPDGSVDTTFSAGAGANNSVAAILPQDDLKYLLFGAFSSLNNANSTALLGRLNGTGTNDLTASLVGSNSLFLSQPAALHVLDDGRVLVGSSSLTNQFTPAPNQEKFGLALLVPAVSLQITQPPASLAVNVGQPASFSVVATGDSPITYQWRKAGAPISGATNPSYSIAATTVADAASYDVVVANIANSQTSASASLTVNFAPLIIAQPQNVSVAPNTAAVFSVAVSAQPEATFQWFKGTAAILGANSSTLVISNPLPADAGTYTVAVHNPLGDVTSGAATLAVANLPVITAAPASTFVSAGGNATLNVTAAGTGALSYQWRRNGVALTGATGASLTVSAVDPTKMGLYDVVVTDGNGSTTSQRVTVGLDSPFLDEAFAPPQFDFISLASRLELLSDGSFVVGTTAGNPTLAQHRSAPFLRYFASGARDESYDFNVPTDFNGITAALPVAGKFYASVLASSYFLDFSRAALVRFNNDGTPDSSFPPYYYERSGSNTGEIRGLALDANGKIVATGFFRDLNGTGRGGIARFNDDGTLDASFQVVTLNAPNGVWSRAIFDAGNRILMGGDFSAVNGFSGNNNNLQGVVRLLSTGAVDTSFVPNGFTRNAPVRGILVQSDGRIVLGGRFTVNGVGNIPFIRLHPNGLIDTSFVLTPIPPQPGGSVAIRELLPLGGDKFVGASFSVYVRNADGSPVPTTEFTPPALLDNVDSAVPEVIALRRVGNGTYLIAGSFTHVNGQPALGLARLAADGTLQPFAAEPMAGTVWPLSFVRTANGHTLAAQTLLNATGGNGLADLGVNGQPAATPFSAALAGANEVRFVGPGGNDRVLAIVVDPAGVRSLRRTLADGALDPAFSIGATFTVTPPDTAVLQPDGKILLFTRTGLSNQDIVIGEMLRRLNADGTLDGTYNPVLEDVASPVRGTPFAGETVGPLLSATRLGIEVIGVDANNKAYVRYAANNGVTRLARLNPDGSRDVTFATITAPSSGVTTSTFNNIFDPLRPAAPAGQVTFTFTSRREFTRVVIQSGGKIVVGGEFTTLNINGTPVGAAGLARLNANGTLDATFNSAGAGIAWTSRAPNAVVYPAVESIVQQPDGKLLLAGNFEAFNGAPAPGLVRVDADGARDATFTAPVYRLARYAAWPEMELQSDGSVLLSAGYVVPGEIYPRGLVRLLTGVAATPAIASFTPTSIETGATVTINGTGFTGTTAVKFNGIDAGSFTVVSDTQLTAVVPIYATSGNVSVITPGGTAVSTAALTVLAGPRLINVSSRGAVGTGENALLSNFTVEGTAAKTILIRAAGPTLANFGIAGALADPTLTVYDGTGAVVATNDDWGGSATLANAFMAVGAFAFSANSKDSALLIPLNPGTYTARVTGVGGTTGQALVEVYDTNDANRLVYLTARSAVSGSTPSITGFVLGGTGTSGNKTVLIRAVGTPLVPALGALTNPTISVYSGSTLVATNNDWGTNTDLAALANATATVGAMPLATSDSALLLSLAPGAYTVQISGASGTSGFALAEVFLVDGYRAPGFAPALLAPLQNRSENPGSSVYFNAPAIGKPGPVTYQWKKNGVNVTGASGVGPSTLFILSATANDAGNYTVAMTSGATTTITAPAMLTINGGATITAQPVSQSVVSGSAATFTITASGAGTLTYQWYFTPAGSSTPQALNDATARFAGTHTASLTISNIQAADAGDYVCMVTNSAGSVSSNAAHLSVSDRLVKVASQTAAPGSTVVVPVQLIAHGDENAVGFSLSFDPTQLTFVSAALGAQAADATLNTNASQTASGRAGIVLAKPTGAVWSAGTQEIVKLTFTLGSTVANATVSPLTFGDTPVVREISSAAAVALPAAYLDGNVTALSGFEADMNGNGAVTVTDWVKVGRIVAGLDPMPTGIDFMKADCAPRSSLGNGALSVTDWVQAGRYAAGLDPLTPVGGPAAP